MDEVEKKTDYRNDSNAGGGMMGFYSNLLTKNVAMGTSVEDAALSAYTSGSKRQASMLHTQETTTASNGDGESNTNHQNNCDSVSVPNSDSTYDSDKNENVKRQCLHRVVTDTNHATSSTDHTMTDRMTASTLPAAAPSTTTAVTSSNDRAQTISSARERYLARKQS